MVSRFGAVTPPLPNLAGSGGSALVGDDPTGRTLLTGSTVFANLTNADVGFGILLSSLVGVGSWRTDAAILAPIAIANTETQMGPVYQADASGASNSPLSTQGISFRVRAAGRYTSGATPGTPIFRVRAGAANNLAGAIVTTVSPTTAANQTNAPFDFEAILTLRTTGAGGTIMGACRACVAGVAGLVGMYLSTNSTDSAIDTTVNTFFVPSFISGNAGTTYTFEIVTIERLLS